jgi:hypothetical protein
MSELEDEKTGVVPACDTEESEITNPLDQNAEKSEDSVTKPSPGRLPARASRSLPLRLV